MGIRRKTKEEFTQEVYKLVKDEYTFLEDYISNKIKLKVRHNICGEVYPVMPNKFLSQGRRCPECAKKLRKDSCRKPINELEEDIKKIHGEDYSYVSGYKNSTTPFIILSNKCKKTFSKTHVDFIGKEQPCTHCGIKKSKGVKQVETFLTKQKIDYVLEFRDKRCINEKELPFDFKFENNGKKILIEIDGEHHFKPTRYYGMSEEKALERHIATVKNDKIKNNFVITHSNEYILIRFNEKNRYLIEKELSALITNNNSQD